MNRAGVLIVAVLALAAAPAGAAAQPGVDLRGWPQALGYASGAALVGDLDGDGVTDLSGGFVDELVRDRPCGRPRDPDGRLQSAIEIYFGGPRFAAPARMPDLVVRCPTTTLGGGTGPVVGVGDMDGDGHDDLAFGGAPPVGGDGSGGVRVRFGPFTAGVIDARLPTARGFDVLDSASRPGLGEDVVPLGDVTGDGRADLAIPYVPGITNLEGDEPPVAPRIAIVHGGAGGGQVVDVARPGTGVTVLTGFAKATRFLGAARPAIAPVGDVDRDGHPDVAIGLPGGPDRSGEALVVAGPLPSGPVELGRLRRLMRVTGFKYLGSAVAAAGDVDGDGTVDLAVGATPSDGTLAFATSPDGEWPGLFVVRGRVGATVDVAEADGVRMLTSRDQELGERVLPIGDVTGDGVPDLAASASQLSPACRPQAGSTYVIPGDRAWRGGSLTRAAAWRIDGDEPGVPSVPVGAADVTGDGARELVLREQDPNSQNGRVAFVPLSWPTTQLADLPDPEDCLRVSVRTTPSLLRRGRITVHVEWSTLGDRRAHEVRVSGHVMPIRRGETLSKALGRYRGGRDPVRTTIRIGPSGRARKTTTIAGWNRKPLRDARDLALSLWVEQAVDGDGIDPSHMTSVTQRLRR